MPRFSRTETKVNMPRRMRTVARAQSTYWGEVATAVPSRASGRSGLRVHFVPHSQMIWMGGATRITALVSAGANFAGMSRFLDLEGVKAASRASQRPPPST